MDALAKKTIVYQLSELAKAETASKMGQLTDIWPEGERRVGAWIDEIDDTDGHELGWDVLTQIAN